MDWKVAKSGSGCSWEREWAGAGAGWFVASAHHILAIAQWERDFGGCMLLLLPYMWSTSRGGGSTLGTGSRNVHAIEAQGIV